LFDGKLGIVRNRIEILAYPLDFEDDTRPSALLLIVLSPAFCGSSAAPYPISLALIRSWSTRRLKITEA